MECFLFTGLKHPFKTFYKAKEFVSNERKRLAKCTKDAFLSKISMVSSVVERYAKADVNPMAQSAHEKLKNAQTRYTVQLETLAQKIVNEHVLLAGSLNPTVAMVETEKRLKQDLKLFELQSETIKEIADLAKVTGEAASCAHETSRTGYIDLNVNILNSRDDIEKKKETLAKLNQLVTENSSRLRLNNIVSHADVFSNALATFFGIETELGIVERTKIIEHLRAELARVPSKSK